MPARDAGDFSGGKRARMTQTPDVWNAIDNAYHRIEIAMADKRPPRVASTHTAPATWRWSRRGWVSGADLAEGAPREDQDRLALYPRIRSQCTRAQIGDVMKAIEAAARDVGYDVCAEGYTRAVDATLRSIESKLTTGVPIDNLGGFARDRARDKFSKQRRRTRKGQSEYREQNPLAVVLHEDGTHDVVDDGDSYVEAPDRASFAEVLYEEGELRRRRYLRAVYELSRSMGRVWTSEDTLLVREAVRGAAPEMKPWLAPLRGKNFRIHRLMQLFWTQDMTATQLAALAIVADACPPPKAGTNATKAFERVEALCQKWITWESGTKFYSAMCQAAELWKGRDRKFALSPAEARSWQSTASV
jgi:hypothetical protein